MPQHHESCSYSLSPTLSCQARASTSLMTTPDKINIFVPQSPLKLSSQELLRWLSVKLAGQPDNTEDDSSGLSSDLKSLFHPHTPTQTHSAKSSDFQVLEFHPLQNTSDRSLRKSWVRAGEMAQRVRALTALLKVLSSNPSNHMVAHNHP